MRVAAIVVSKDSAPRALETIGAQTVKVDRVVLADKVFPGYYWVQSIGLAINSALGELDLDSYDYVLRMDGDAILPRNFLEENLKLGADVVGIGGSALLFRTSVIKRMGMWPVMVQEDSYFIHKARMLGFIYKKPKVRTVKLRQVGSHYGFRDHVYNGVVSYRMGYEPLHLLHHMVNLTKTARKPQFAFATIAYFAAFFFWHGTRYDVAPSVQAAQLHSIAKRL